MEDTYPGSIYQPLFDHMLNEHGLILLDTEMTEICEVCRKIINAENNQ